MADESTILEVGALINLEQYLPGIDKMAAETKLATGTMTQSFQQLATSTFSSTAQMTTAFVPVTAAMQVIPPAVQKVEVTTEESTSRMGALWELLATTVRGASESIVGSLTGMDAKIAGTAERAGLEVGAMRGAFSGLSSLLGAGIAVGFAAHFLDELAGVEVKLGHLSEQTDIAVTSLSGLRAITQQAGEDFGPLSLGLIRMQRAQVAAIEGNKAMEQAFKQVGISIQELTSMRPEELFFRLTTALNGTENTAIRNATALAIFSRAGKTLPPLLQEIETRARAAGMTTEEYVKSVGKTTGVTDQSVAAAAEWTRVTAQLSQQFQAGLIPVLTWLSDNLGKIAQGFDLIGAAVIGVIDIFKPLATAVAGQIVLFQDLVTFNFAAMPAHFHDIVTRMNQDFTDIGDNFKAAYRDWNGMFASTPPKTYFQQAQDMLTQLAKNRPVDLSELVGVGKGNTQVQQWREQLDQMRDAETGFHELSKAEEATFWQSKLALTKSGSAQHREVYHEYVTAEREANKQSLAEEVNSVEQRVQAERTGSIERIVILQEELSHLESLDAQKTAEYRRLQEQLKVAERETAKENERVFTEQIVNELAETKSATEKMAIIRHATLQADLAGYGANSDAFRRLKQEEVTVERDFVAEQRSISSTDSDIEKASAQSILDIRRARIATEFSLGLISNSQRLALERFTITEEIGLEQKAVEEKVGVRAEELAEYERLLKQLSALNTQYNSTTNEATRNELAKEIDLVRQAMAEKSTLYQHDPVAYETALKQMLALTDKYNKLMAASDNEELKSRTAGWQKFDQQISADFGNAINKMVLTGKGFGDSLAQSWNKMVADFAGHLAAMLAKWALTYALMELVEHSSVARSIATHIAAVTTKITTDTAANTKNIAETLTGNATMTTSDAAYTTAHVTGAAARAVADTASIGVSLPETLTTNVAKVTSDAGVAGAAGFASVMVALPFPENVAVAPGVMAASIAATLSNLPLAAAERGALLGHDTTLLAHANEMILPPNLSTGIQNAINTGGFGAPPALTQNFSSAGGAGATSTSTTRTYHTTVAPVIEYHQHGGQGPSEGELHSMVVNAVRVGIRRGQINLGGGDV